MKSKFIGISIVLLVTMIAVSCKKNKNEITYITNSINSELKAKFLFNSGSYWVYENQSGQLDSVFVIDMEEGTNEIPCPHGCPGGVISRNDYARMDLASSFETTPHNFYFRSNYIKYNGGGSYGEYGQPLFIYSQQIGSELYGATIVEKFDTFVLLGNTYLNVTRIRVSENDQYQHEFDHDTDFYFAENVGLIKKESFDPVNGNTVWSLLRYQIQ